MPKKNKTGVIIKFISILILIIFISTQITACGFTPVKKSATRKKINSKENPELAEVKKIKKVTAHKDKVASAAPNSKLIFSSNRSGNLEIWISELDGSKPLQLTDNKNFESWWPRVSPDRSKVLFYRSPKGTDESTYDEASLWQIDSNGENEIELIPQGEYGWSTQGIADWSPDGSKIVMAAANSKNHWHLYITDSNGKHPSRISKRESLYLDPSWSPDGNKIVYTAFPSDYNGNDLKHLEIFTSDINGDNETRLTNDKFRDHAPYWSPDGQWIAFETQVMPLYWLLGKWALRTVPANGGQTIELINDGHVNSLPRWNPDSTQIYFHRLRFREDKKFGLWRINADGSDLIKITSNDDYKDIQVDVY